MLGSHLGLKTESELVFWLQSEQGFQPQMAEIGTGIFSSFVSVKCLAHFKGFLNNKSCETSC